jgi:hypothetical protein
MQQTLVDIRFELIDMQRDARQDKHEADERYHALQAMLHAVATRFGSIFISTVVICRVLSPFALHCFIFLYPHIEDIVQFKFGGLCTHFVLNYAVVYFKLWFDFHL